MREIITEWQSVNSPGGLSVMYFADTGPSVDDMRDALAAFWGVIDGSLDSGTDWRIRTEGRELSAATGAVTGYWADGTAHVGNGAINNDPVPNSSQVLIRWNTGVVVGGRGLRGRTFVPGLAAELTTQGEIAAAYVGTMQVAAQALCDAAVGFGVWHRPVAGSGGAHHVATAASVWSELAVQRGRR